MAEIGQHRGGGDQGFGIGVLWIGENLFGFALLDDLAGIHHHDPVGHAAHDTQIV